ncbi:MAG: septal ring lytic transglycosylase RlpA family protein [Bryobacteraceae bacterium]
MFIVMTAGCARKTTAHLPPPPSVPPRIGATETGLASWYGAPYDGRPAASGEIYAMQEFTAAHRTLPFGAWVEVNDLDNGKRVNVRITDRGPFVDERIIDLSLAAARAIDMVGPGIARVRLTVIAAPAGELPRGQSREAYAVQAGAFSDRERAESLCGSLSERFHDTRVVESSVLWRVLVGRRLTLDAANQLAVKIRRESGEAIVVRDR